MEMIIMMKKIMKIGRKLPESRS
jgi:hypothetical protein